MGTSLAIDKETGQRRVVLADEILFLFFGNGIVCFECYDRYFPVLDDVHFDNKTSSTEIQEFIYF